MEEGRQTYRFKLVMVGGVAVGKSCLVKRFVEGTYGDIGLTIGAAFFSKTIAADGYDAK